MNQVSKSKVVFLMGPTATGKTDVAIYLAKHLPLEIISVDSSLVYKGMDIGTAKPGKQELEETPHHLINIREPENPYSAAEFCVDAKKEIEQILAANKIPLLVGGTMFYFHALEYGLSDLPEANPEVRAKISSEANLLGWPAIHKKLKGIDEKMASKIDPNDGQRIQRAMEVFQLSGLPPSSLMAETSTFNHIPVKLALVPSDRKWLHRRIEERFEAMLGQGLVSEVDNILKKPGIDPSLPAMRMVGYRQVREYLIGDISYSQMKDRAIAATRQLAKRQLTWIRHYEGIRSFDSLDANSGKNCLEYLRQSL